MEPTFFEIPIYRCNRNSHTKMMEGLRKKYVREEIKEMAPTSYANMEYHFDTELWYPWKYNEIVGFLNLYVMGSQFRVESWFIKKKRINAGIIKKKFLYQGKCLEEFLPQGLPSNELFDFVLESLITLNKEEFKGYYFDLTTFKVVGQYINWNDLFDKLNSFKYPELRNKYYDDLR